MPENTLTFRPYAGDDRDACCALFEENCPAYFALNEREDYLAFLSSEPDNYLVVSLGDRLAAAFGFEHDLVTRRGRVCWIMVSPAAHGSGVGTAMMSRILEIADDADVDFIDIAASHLSAPFFARFDAIATQRIDDGWGPGMHRIDMEIDLARGVGPPQD